MSLSLNSSKIHVVRFSNTSHTCHTRRPTTYWIDCLNKVSHSIANTSKNGHSQRLHIWYACGIPNCWICSLMWFVRVFCLCTVIRIKWRYDTRFVFWVPHSLCLQVFLSGVCTANIVFSFEYCMKNVNKSVEEDREKFSLQFFFSSAALLSLY